jgi:hypothetical protein
MTGALKKQGGEGAGNTVMSIGKSRTLRTKTRKSVKKVTPEALIASILKTLRNPNSHTPTKELQDDHKLLKPVIGTVLTQAQYDELEAAIIQRGKIRQQQRIQEAQLAKAMGALHVKGEAGGRLRTIAENNENY